MSGASGGPAFPVHGGQYEGDDPRNRILGGGMDLRDYFAAKALAALIAVPKDDVKRGAAGVPILARYAYEYADAMLAERSRSSEPPP